MVDLWSDLSSDGIPDDRTLNAMADGTRTRYVGMVMCGRFSQLTDAPELAELFGVDASGVRLEARYNLAPSFSQTALPSPLIVRAAPGGGRELVRARWWMIPRFWRKPLRDLPAAFNARVEDLATKPFFRESFESRRCLVPINGWYEFRGECGKKEAYYATVKDGQPFAWAGLWDEWTSPEGELVTSFTVITTEPSAFVRPYHPRMAVMLAPADYAPWLDPTCRDTALLTAILLKGYEPQLEARRVSRFVNSVRNEGPQCIEPPEQGSLF